MATEIMWPRCKFGIKGEIIQNKIFPDDPDVRYRSVFDLTAEADGTRYNSTRDTEYVNFMAQLDTYPGLLPTWLSKELFKKYRGKRKPARYSTIIPMGGKYAVPVAVITLSGALVVFLGRFKLTELNKKVISAMAWAVKRRQPEIYPGEKFPEVITIEVTRRSVSAAGRLSCKFGVSEFSLPQAEQMERDYTEITGFCIDDNGRTFLKELELSGLRNITQEKRAEIMQEMRRRGINKIVTDTVTARIRKGSLKKRIDLELLREKFANAWSACVSIVKSNPSLSIRVHAHSSSDTGNSGSTDTTKHVEKK